MSYVQPVMSEFTLIHDTVDPPVYLVAQVPGLALACIGKGPEACWLTLALGETKFSKAEEEKAQRFMRCHGLDYQRYNDLQSCAEAVRKALDQPAQP